jgi:hypothetical protein
VEIRRHVEALIARVRDGEGKASREARQAAFDRPEGPLLSKVAAHAYKVTDEDVAAATAAASEDEIFELVVCTAIGQAKRQYDAALAALAALAEAERA